MVLNTSAREIDWIYHSQIQTLTAKSWLKRISNLHFKNSHLASMHDLWRKTGIKSVCVSGQYSALQYETCPYVSVMRRYFIPLRLTQLIQLCLTPVKIPGTSG
jgi:hypothetical protein